MKTSAVHASLFVKSGSCRGSVGKRRRPRPINRHASTKAVGYWGPWRSALDLWLRPEAKSEGALGPGLLSAFWEVEYYLHREGPNLGKHCVPRLLLPSALDAQFRTPYPRSTGFNTDIGAFIESSTMPSP